MPEIGEINLKPATVNIRGLIEHDSWSLSLTLTVAGEPYDLTDLEVIAKMNSGSAKYNIHVEVTDAEAGELTLSQTNAPLIDNGVWKLRVGVRTILRGKVFGEPEFT